MANDMTVPRKLIPDSRTIVVLDTCVVRRLKDTPRWAKVFRAMARNGYCFCLSDVASVEIFNQLSRASIKSREFSRIVKNLRLFLHHEVPILFGKRDLFGMLGFPLGAGSWSEKEARFSSKRAWNLLRHQGVTDRFIASSLLAEARDEWKELFNKVVAPDDSLATTESALLADVRRDHDNICECHPPMSTRQDFYGKRLVKLVCSNNLSSGGYNPESKKKKNDGIDIDLFHYQMLPAFILTYDKNIHSGLADISSFQRDWIYRPDDFATEWQHGRRPKLSWPTA